jgi:hypothetical protein
MGSAIELMSGAITSSLLVISARAFEAAAQDAPSSRVRSSPYSIPATEARSPKT